MLRTLRRPIAHRTCTRLPTSRPAATRSVRVARHTTPIRLPNTLQTRSFFRSRTVRYEDEEDPSTWIFDVSDETFQEQVVGKPCLCLSTLSIHFNRVHVTRHQIIRPQY